MLSAEMARENENLPIRGTHIFLFPFVCMPVIFSQYHFSVSRAIISRTEKVKGRRKQ